MADPRTPENAENPFQPCDIRLSWHVANSAAMTYGTDNSETICYRFNNLGFRGEDYDPDAAFHVCVFGESNTFGLGVAEDETFGYVLKSYIAEALDLEIAQINLLNMGVAGISADHCVRSAFRQLNGQKIDLVICQLPAVQRREYFDGKRFRSLVIPGDELTDERIAAMPAPLVGFCEMYTPQLCQLDYVKNMLLLHNFLKSQGIPFLISSHSMPKNKGERDYLWPFFRHLDPDNLVHHRWFNIKPDIAADGRHPGVRSHVACAIELLQSYANLLENTDPGDLSKRLKTKARDLKKTDPDWAYCKQFANDRRKAQKAERQADNND